MKLRCISTGSKGNTYALISSVGEILLLDLGASEKEIKIALDFNVSGIVGAVVTHIHVDHSHSVKAIENIGIPVFKPYEMAKFQAKTVKYGNYTITAFALDDKECIHWQHTNGDSTECPIYGFYITHSELEGALIYSTDCKLIKWNFKKQKPGHILLGVDYQQELLDKDNPKFNHVLQGHMNIDTACEFVKANNTDKLKTILIGHLSKHGADKEYFINELSKVANCPIYVCEKGIEYNLESEK